MSVPPEAGAWRYQGPADPEQGGHWYRLEGWEHGYAEAVRVIDLESACGFRGAVLVEALVVLLPETDQELAECLQAIGLTPATLPQGRPQGRDRGGVSRPRSLRPGHHLARAAERGAPARG